MPLRGQWIGVIALTGACLVSLEAAVISRQSGESFSKKVTQVRLHAEGDGSQARRTTFTQDELNSWLMYQGQPLLPNGVTQPQVTIVGDGQLAGQATVDLEAIGKKRSTGGTFDPWSLLGGKVPLTVRGILHTRDGMGKLEIQSAEVSGVPVPLSVLQELVGFYSRTPDHPEGLRLDQTFSLPARIKQIEVGQSQAVVVQ